MMAVICMVLGLGYSAQAQTDAMYTKYMFNSLAFNPAYAGSKEYMTINLLHRTQWLGIKGGPNTQSLTFHSPMKGYDKIALGLGIINHRVGISQVTTINGNYAFRIPMGKNPLAGKLSIGLVGGMTNWRTDLSQIDVYDSFDESYDQDYANLWLPNFGFGLYYYSEYFFIGASLPNLLRHDLRKQNVSSARHAQVFRHYYVTLGGAIPLKGKDLVFKPMALVRTAGFFNNETDSDGNVVEYGTPTEFTVDLSMFIMQKVWLGFSFRSAVEAFSGSSSYDSANIWASYHLKSGLHFGVAYDYTLTELQQLSQASFEVMVGYDLNVNKRNAYHPRYF